MEAIHPLQIPLEVYGLEQWKPDAERTTDIGQLTALSKWLTM